MILSERERRLLLACFEQGNGHDFNFEEAGSAIGYGLDESYDLAVILSKKGIFEALAFGNTGLITSVGREIARTLKEERNQSKISEPALPPPPSTGPKFTEPPALESQYQAVEKMLTEHDYSILGILHDAAQTPTNGCTRPELRHMSNLSAERVDVSISQLSKFSAIHRIGQQGKEGLYAIGPVGEEYLARRRARNNPPRKKKSTTSYPDLSGPEYCVLATMMNVSTFYIGGRPPAEMRGGLRADLHRQINGLHREIIDAALTSLIDKGLMTDAGDGHVLLSSNAADTLNYTKSNSDRGLLRDVLVHLAENFVKPSEIIAVDGINCVLQIDRIHGALDLYLELQRQGLIIVKTGLHQFECGFGVFMPRPTKDKVDAWTISRAMEEKHDATGNTNINLIECSLDSSAEMQMSSDASDELPSAANDQPAGSEISEEAKARLAAHFDASSETSSKSTSEQFSEFSGHHIKRVTRKSGLFARLFSDTTVEEFSAGPKKDMTQIRNQESNKRSWRFGFTIIVIVCILIATIIAAWSKGSSPSNQVPTTPPASGDVPGESDKLADFYKRTLADSAGKSADDPAAAATKGVFDDHVVLAWRTPTQLPNNGILKHIDVWVNDSGKDDWSIPEKAGTSAATIGRFQVLDPFVTRLCLKTRFSGSFGS